MDARADNGGGGRALILRTKRQHLSPELDDDTTTRRLHNRAYQANFSSWIALHQEEAPTGEPQNDPN